MNEWMNEWQTGVVLGHEFHYTCLELSQPEAENHNQLSGWPCPPATKHRADSITRETNNTGKQSHVYFQSTLP